MTARMLILGFICATLLSGCSGTRASLNSSPDGVLESFMDSSSVSTTRKAHTETTPSPAASQRQYPSDGASRLITGGDSIAVTVWGYPEFSTRTVVKANGRILVPFLGDIEATGLTESEFTIVLRQQLARLVQGELQLSIEVIPPLMTVIVVGSVARPGTYTVPHAIPLLDALSIAGGWLTQADLKNVKIVRRGVADSPIIIDLAVRLETNDLETLPTVLPGDAIIVPQEEDLVLKSAGFFGGVFGILLLLGIVSGFQ